MILRISLQGTIKDSNPNINLNDWFDAFAQVIDQDERFAKAIALFFDYESPLDQETDIDQRFDKVQKLFEFTDEEIENFRYAIGGWGSEGWYKLIYDAIQDYTQYQSDLAKQFKQSLAFQVSSLSHQLTSTRIDITAEKDEKAFDRFNTFSKEAGNIYKNINTLASYEHKDFEQIKAEVDEKLAKEETQKSQSGVKGINQAKKQVKQNGK